MEISQNLFEMGRAVTEQDVGVRGLSFMSAAEARMFAAHV